MRRDDVTASRRQGEQDARDYQDCPDRLSALRLSRYNEGPTTLRMARALFLSLPGRALLLGLLRIITRSSTRWHNLADDVDYWTGVQEVLGDSEAWRGIRWSGVPILLYHRVTPKIDKRDPKYAIPLARFNAQMRFLAWLGYRTVSLEDVIAHHQSGQLLPPKVVAITFDDGYEDNLLAVRSMKRHGFSGTIFLVTDELGGYARWRSVELGQVRMLSWEQARDITYTGTTFGAHSATHPRLTALSVPEAQHEIDSSTRTLQHELGPGNYLFAYPHGMANAETRSLVAQAGYCAACGTTRGLSTLHDDPLYLRRIQVYGDDSLLSFWLRLSFGDNPLDYLPWGRLGRWRKRQ